MSKKNKKKNKSESTKFMYYPIQVQKAAKFIAKKNLRANLTIKEVETMIYNWMAELKENLDTTFISSAGVTVYRWQEDDRLYYFDVMVDASIAKMKEDFAFL